MRMSTRAQTIVPEPGNLTSVRSGNAADEKRKIVDVRTKRLERRPKMSTLCANMNASTLAKR
jgi:hypothetical protein